MQFSHRKPFSDPIHSGESAIVQISAREPPYNLAVNQAEKIAKNEAMPL